MEDSQQHNPRSLGIMDKMGEPIYENDVVFDNEDYYRIYYNETVQQVEAHSCRKGYLHDVSQEQAGRFKRIGPVEEFGQLLNCDSQVPLKDADHFFTR